VRVTREFYHKQQKSSLHRAAAFHNHTSINTPVSSLILDDHDIKSMEKCAPILGIRKELNKFQSQRDNEIPSLQHIAIKII